MSAKFVPVEINTAPKLIAAQIKERILSGDLKVDERLPTEEELCTLFNVSRHTIREALKRLAAQNLIVSRRGAAGGNFVRVPTWINIQEALTTSLTVAASMNELTFEQLVECRLQMGVMCVSLAATKCRASDLTALGKEVVFQKREDVTDVEFCASDVRFHSLIAAATRNPVIAATVAGVMGGLEPIANLILFRFRDRAVIAAQHEELVACLKRRDVKAATSCLEAQVAYLRESHSSAKKWHSSNVKPKAGKTT